MKKRIYQSLITALLLLPLFYFPAHATGPDTLWTRNFWRELNATYPDNFEFHPTNDSIFIFTSFGKDSNGIDTDEMTVHFVNTITGQVFKKYAPIHNVHYTPDGNFLIGHNDSTIAYISLDSMKPVRTYPVMNGHRNYTLDEKGKYVYSTFNYIDTVRKMGFYRWDISNGTIKTVYLPDTLLDDGGSSCPITSIAITSLPR
jgi:hypothetical protein